MADPDKQIKLYNNVEITCDEGKREVVGIINTNAIDQEGEVVQPKGLKKKNFQGNPVVFANHSYMFDPKALPIGTCKWVKASTDKNGNDVIIAKTFITDKTQEGRDVFGLMQDGVLRAFSVGFTPIRKSRPTTQEINARPDLKDCKAIIREWDMYEYSVVGLPCNPEALALAVSKGYSAKMIDILSGKVENTNKVAAEIVEAIEAEPAYQENKMTMKEMKSILSNRIDSSTKAINCDVVVDAVLKRLFIK